MRLKLFMASCYGPPTVCCCSIIFMWISIASFIVAGTYVAFRGITITAHLPLCPS